MELFSYKATLEKVYKDPVQGQLQIRTSCSSQDSQEAGGDHKSNPPKKAHVLKFVFVGDASTGKTSLLTRYVDNKFSIAYETTMVDFKSTEITYDNTAYKLYLWDTAGQETYRALGPAYYRNAVGGFVVYDVSNRKSFGNCQQWKKEIDDFVRLLNGDPIPTILIANKVDCGEYINGKQFSETHDFVDYFETSAKTGHGIREAILSMVKKIHQLLQESEVPLVPTHLIRCNPVRRTTKCCCTSSTNTLT